ncbi:cytochrome P450 [Mycobacterium xenopi]|uniref:Cytochrome P450 n=1 Tax=Mycobacterium xenopi TaxID=1789 RepID=A0AAD1LZS7_MYCXE|nr:cytochrome P450 [Mycobacterium xenopi]MDA3642133.1 cytochrome P450 [Mycobacterium xenopi]MDA3658046.1 cytochrome P450 [Mycobacterium xenopi]MDA3664616.1 cytochrome P450 [Mycobacterium xenopi]SPX78974.1 cytochrome P450 [Mycobacterium xenopi]BBU21127.1 cytochrome P450 [Mycobacterium xenopi]
MIDQSDDQVLEYRFLRGGDPPCSNFARLDRFQERHRPFRRVHEDANDYWVMTDHDAILEGLQQPELFSNAVMVPIEPNPPYKWIPMMLDPPEHGKWRHVLGLYFSPGRVSKLEDAQRAFAAELIEKFRGNGSCDFYTDFAAVFPTTIFLQIMGLPTDKLEDFMRWEDKILHATPESDPDRSMALNAMLEVMGYFSGLITQKREDPGARGDDIVSHAIEWKIDGEAPSDNDLLSCMLLLFMAGLDTVAAQLSYAFYHLATHPADREKLVADPSKAPEAVEELVRAYAIVQTARIATKDMDFHGCPIKKGDIVAFPLGMANRDPNEFPRGGTVDFDAPRPRHIAFGAGPHRCLGSHLARQEMTVALQEWHRRIPDYEIADESVVSEHTGGVYSLDRLPLRWNI